MANLLLIKGDVTKLSRYPAISSLSVVINSAVFRTSHQKPLYATIYSRYAHLTYIDIKSLTYCLSNNINYHMAVNVQINANELTRLSLQKKTINGIPTLVEYIPVDPSLNADAFPGGSITLMFRDTLQNPLPKESTKIFMRAPDGTETAHSLTFDGILVLDDLSLGNWQVLRVENTYSV